VSIAYGCGAHVKTPVRRLWSTDPGPVAPQATVGALHKPNRCRWFARGRPARTVSHTTGIQGAKSPWRARWSWRRGVREIRTRGIGSDQRNDAVAVSLAPRQGS